tara:strand:+ start:1984 stop:2382 length:399 start_codon:yes stop_codon:yes gene_type:complete
MTSLNPDIWGPHTWIFLHAVAHTYPENPSKDDKERYSDFFTSLQYVLPCSVCRDHLKDIIRDQPIQLESQKTLQYWLIDIHNSVNRILGQSEIDYNDVDYALYNVTPSISSHIFNLVLVCLIIIIISFCLKK